MDFGSLAAVLCLAAGAVVSWVKDQKQYVLAFAAGSFLVLAEAIQEIKQAA